jgi:hypothetical protein
MNYVDRISDGVQLRFYLPEGYEYNAKYNIALRGFDGIQEFSVAPRSAFEGTTLSDVLPDFDTLLTSTGYTEEQVTEMKESVHTIDVQGKDAIAYNWTSPIEGDFINYWESVYWEDEYGRYHVLWDIETDDKQEWVDSLDQFHALLQIAETGPVSSFSENGDSGSSSKTQQQSEGVNEYAKRIQPPASDGTPEGSYTVELYPELVPVGTPEESIYATTLNLKREFEVEDGTVYWEDAYGGRLFTIPDGWHGKTPPVGIDLTGLAVWDDPKSGGMYVFGYWY